MLWDITYLVPTDTPLQLIFSLWGRRWSNGNIYKQKWKVIRKDRVLVGKMPAASKLRVASEHSPGPEETLAQPFAH